MAATTAVVDDENNWYSSKVFLVMVGCAGGILFLFTDLLYASARECSAVEMTKIIGYYKEDLSFYFID